jgi:hypothetical protein
MKPTEDEPLADVGFCKIGDRDDAGLCFYDSKSKKRLFGFRFKSVFYIYLLLSAITMVNGFVHGYALEGTAEGAFRYAALMTEYAAAMVFSFFPLINIMVLVFFFMVTDMQPMFMERSGILATNEWLDLSYGMFMRFFST